MTQHTAADGGLGIGVRGSPGLGALIPSGGTETWRCAGRAPSWPSCDFHGAGGASALMTMTMGDGREGMTMGKTPRKGGRGQSRRDRLCSSVDPGIHALMLFGWPLVFAWGITQSSGAPGTRRGPQPTPSRNLWAHHAASAAQSCIPRYRYLDIHLDASRAGIHIFQIWTIFRKQIEYGL